MENLGAIVVGLSFAATFAALGFACWHAWREEHCRHHHNKGGR